MKLIMSQQEFEEALEKARKEGAAKAKGGDCFCYKCDNFVSTGVFNSCKLHAIVGLGAYDFCSFFREKKPKGVVEY